MFKVTWSTLNAHNFLNNEDIFSQQSFSESWECKYWRPFIFTFSSYSRISPNKGLANINGFTVCDMSAACKLQVIILFLTLLFIITHTLWLTFQFIFSTLYDFITQCIHGNGQFSKNTWLECQLLCPLFTEEQKDRSASIRSKYCRSVVIVWHGILANVIAVLTIVKRTMF